MLISASSDADGRRRRRDSMGSPGLVPGTDEYGSAGKIRRNGMDTSARIEVPQARSRRKAPVSSLKTRVETLDQNNALSPKAAKGKAVAVPRWSGKLEAAKHIKSVSLQDVAIVQSYQS